MAINRNTQISAAICFGVLFFIKTPFATGRLFVMDAKATGQICVHYTIFPVEKKVTKGKISVMMV